MGKQPCRQRYFLSALFLLVIASPVCVPAQPPLPSPQEESAGDAYNLAVQAANREDYREALQQIQQAIAQRPENLDYQYFLGVTYYHLQRMDEAESIFTALLLQDEKRFQKVHFDLAHVLVQKGKDQEALDQIEKGRAYDPGQADYEIGILAIRMKRFADAIEPLKQAALAKPDLAAEATTQLAIAHYQLKQYKEAEKSLKKVLQMKLPPQKAEEIRKMLETVETAIRVTKKWGVSAAMGFQYDTNVFQTPLQQANFQATRFSEEQAKTDAGFITALAGHYLFLEEGPWHAGVAYNHYAILYGEHSDLDAVGARPSLYGQWEQGPYRAELQYSYSHFWVGGDSWLNAHSILPRFSMQHGNRWRTELSSGVEWHLYEDETPDDTLYYLGGTEFFFLREGKAHIRGGYLIGYENLVPEDAADYRIHEWMLGIQWPVLQDKWFLDLSGRYILRDFNFDPLMSEDKDRLDQEKDLNVLIFGPLTPYLQLSFLFQYIWNDSNLPNPPDLVDLYSYRRTVYTWMLTYNY